MNSTDIISLLPPLVLGVFTLVMLLALAVKRSPTLLSWLGIAGVVAAGASIVPAASVAPVQATMLALVNTYTLFFWGVLLASAGAALVFMRPYMRNHPRPEEGYLLVLLATVGGMTLVASTHFASLFLGLELLSIPVLALAGYSYRASGLEAALKYLVMSGVASAFVLFGMALFYADTGSMALSQLHGVLVGASLLHRPYPLIGIALLLAGLSFKISLVPFHFWTPDVYQGSPAPVTGFLATVSKVAVLAMTLRYLTDMGAASAPGYSVALALLAMSSMVVGNLLALSQRSVKRMLSYSSIAHMGYVFIPVVAGGSFALEAASYYLTAYAVMSLLAFGVVSYMSTLSEDADDMSAYTGLFWRRPWLAGTMTLALLSLAGMPFTMGFFGKFYLFTAGLDAGLNWPIATLVLGSVIGLFYYLGLIIEMGRGAHENIETSTVPAIQRSVSSTAVLAVLCAALVVLGLYPEALIHFIAGGG